MGILLTVFSADDFLLLGSMINYREGIEPSQSVSILLSLVVTAICAYGVALFAMLGKMQKKYAKFLLLIELAFGIYGWFWLTFAIVPHVLFGWSLSKR